MSNPTRLSRYGRALNPRLLSVKDVGWPVTATGYIGVEGDHLANVPWGSLTGTLDRVTLAQSRKSYGLIAYLIVSGVPVTLTNIDQA